MGLSAQSMSSNSQHSPGCIVSENRLHSSIGHRKPVAKVNEHYRENNPKRQPAPGQLALY